jgi:hypothetical protein
VENKLSKIEISLLLLELENSKLISDSNKAVFTAIFQDLDNQEAVTYLREQYLT